MTNRGDGKFDNADLALLISLIARVAAQFTHELCYGMSNPHFCSAEPGLADIRFLEAIEPFLKQIKQRRGRMSHPAPGGDGKE